MAKYRYVIDNVTPDLCEEVFYIIHKVMDYESFYPFEDRVEIYEDGEDEPIDVWDAGDFYYSR